MAVSQVDFYYKHLFKEKFKRKFPSPNQNKKMTTEGVPRYSSVIGALPRSPLSSLSFKSSSQEMGLAGARADGT